MTYIATINDYRPTQHLRCDTCGEETFIRSKNVPPAPHECWRCQEKREDAKEHDERLAFQGWRGQNYYVAGSLHNAGRVFDNYRNDLWTAIVWGHGDTTVFCSESVPTEDEARSLVEKKAKEYYKT